MEPRRAQAEVFHLGGKWRKATVLGWHRLDVARRQSLTGYWIFWLVHLRLEGGQEGWYQYVRLNLRPLNASSSSDSGK